LRKTVSITKKIVINKKIEMCNISFVPERVTLNVSPFFDFILLTEREPIPECFNFQFKFLAEKNRIPEKDAGKIEVKSRKKIRKRMMESKHQNLLGRIN